MVKIAGFRALLILLLVFYPQITNAEYDPVDEIVSARSLADNRDLDRAIEKTTAAVEPLIEKFGDSHIYVAYAFDDLSRYYQATGEFAEALVHSHRAVAISESNANLLSSDKADILHNFAAALLKTGELFEARAVFEKVLGERQNEGKQKEVVRVLGILGRLQVDLTEFDAAFSYLNRAADIARRSEGHLSNHHISTILLLVNSELLSGNSARASRLLEDVRSAIPELEDMELVIRIRVMQARIDIYNSHLGSAQKWLENSLELYSKNKFKQSLLYASIHYNRAVVALLRGEALLAEEYYQIAIEHYSKETGAFHPSTLRAMQGLALTQMFIGDLLAADRYFFDIANKVEEKLGKNHPMLIKILPEWVHVQIGLEKFEEALLNANRAKSLLSVVTGVQIHDRAVTEAARGFALSALGRASAAIESLNRATELFAEAKGRLSADLIPGYLELIELYLERQEDSSAIRYIERTEELVAVNQANSPSKSGRLALLTADMERQLNGCSHSVGYALEGVEGIIRYTTGTSGQIGYTRTSLKNDRDIIEKLALELTNCLAPTDSVSSIEEGLFQAIQLPRLQTTSAAVSQLSNLSSTQNIDLERLLNQRKEISLGLTVVIEKIKNSKSGKNRGYKKLTSLKNSLTDRLRKINTEIESIDETYANYHLPTILTIRKAQALLEQKEGLVSFLVMDNSVLAILVTKTEKKIALSTILPNEIPEIVSTLRQSTNVKAINSMSDFPYFDVEAAHRLYQVLFGEFSGELSSLDHLHIVADGALQRLPLSMILTSAVAGAPREVAQFKDLPFLIKQYSLSYLPSIHSLSVLRKSQSTGRSSKEGAFVGFGDPILGTVNKSGEGHRTRTAEDNANIAGTGGIELVDLFDRLPDSAEEMVLLSSYYPKDRVSLFLGEDATKEQVKKFKFQNLEVLAFATHGVMVDELAPIITEPGLLLSTNSSNRVNSALITANEIAALEIDAEMVLLSACNTAAPGSSEIGAEGLSGLARAFFYAGSRSLLVSHWYVESESAMQTTTNMLRQYKNVDADTSKAKALKDTVLLFLDGEFGKIKRHPAFWAPFVLVGD